MHRNEIYREAKEEVKHLLNLIKKSRRDKKHMFLAYSLGLISFLFIFLLKIRR
jgi:hypothetical protein